jgi:hypothetical protein
MRITLALADGKVPKGRQTELRVAGGTRSSGSSGGSFVHKIQGIEKEVISGCMRYGRMRIVYVEGDCNVCVDPGMTVETFAKVNKGNFIVVVAGLQ